MNLPERLAALRVQFRVHWRALPRLELDTRDHAPRDR